jgi:UDP-N-acetyl-D-glucosamine dehydrogenase
MPFYPGPGVGGHCIPLDPTYLAWLVRRDVGKQFRMVEQAQDINSQMPRHVADRIGEALSDAGRPLKGASVLVLGVTYKADVGDDRESPAVKVIAQLRRRGAKVSFYDPYVDRLPVNGDVLEAVSVGPRVLSEAHCVALLTPHRLFDLEWIAKHARLVFDGRNAYESVAHPNVVRL